MEQFPGYIMSDNQAHNNELFVFADTTLHQGQLDLTGYEDFMNFSYPVSSGGDAMDGNTSAHLFSSMQRLDVQTNDPHFSSHGTGNDSLYKQQQELSHGPNHPPTPPFTSPQIMQNTPTSSSNGKAASPPNRTRQDTSMGNSDAADDVLGELVDLLAQPGAWDGIPNKTSDETVALSHDARDRIVATVQLLLHRALETGCSSSSSSSSEGLFGRIVSLPPSHVLMHFVQLYAARIDTIQPYLGLPGSPVASIQDILQVDAADVGMLLIILFIAHGAMIEGNPKSQIFAHGLIEVCRVALDHVLERRSISQPMVGGIAIQLLTLCARSGKDCFTSVC
jgi:hypothetical protein